MLNIARKAPRFTGIVRCLSDGRGSGSGHGGGSGGSIRDAGGAFGKMEAAREDEFFYKKQKEQIRKMKEDIEQEVEHHKGQLENHKKVLERHQQRISELEAQERALGKE